MNRNSLHGILFAFIAILAAVPPLSAQVVLKPNGQNAVPLRTKAIRADVAIHRQFADTLLTLTFQNQTYDRIEADFIYTLPPRTIVTSFAYWYGDEKVPARIMEKEEAAAIYRHITERMHDPALVEMIGKNTFRARIFPVMPNSDLKVEMRLAQTLESTSRGARYRFPLSVKAGETLDDLHVHVHIDPDPEIAGVANNYGLPITDRPEGYGLTLAGKSRRPQKDLTVSLVRSRRPLQAELYAANSGRSDGFFALALTPDRTLRRPRVQIRGVETYQVVPISQPSVKAFDTLVAVGRYRGGGPATVVLSGQSRRGRVSLSRSVQFGAHRVHSNLAARLWAAQRMEQLSAGGGNRSIVIAISKRFGLPSRYTSWLAVPTEEMQRYDREIAQAKLETIATRYVDVASRYGKQSGAALKLYASLQRQCRIADISPKEALNNYLNAFAERINDRARQYANQMSGSNDISASDIRIPEELRRQFVKIDWVVNNENTAQAQKTLHDVLNEVAYRARHGDPLICVAAPPDALQVIALMPGGEIKRLVYNPTSGRWEARFDIPTYVTEGEYVITVVIVLKDGTRRTLTLRYRVDMTPPTGAGRARIVRNERPSLRLEMEADADTARVKALLPWGEWIELRWSAQSHRFVALVPLSAEQRAQASVVTYILTDRAHNRTTLQVDMRDSAADAR